MIRNIENDIKGNVRKQFNATLLSVSNKVLTNRNGKQYRVVNIQFVDRDGVVQTASGFMYEANFLHGVEIGKDYLSTVSLTPTGPFITVSHLEAGADRATVDMFFDEIEVANTPIIEKMPEEITSIKEKGVIAS